MQFAIGNIVLYIGGPSWDLTVAEEPRDEKTHLAYARIIAPGTGGWDWQIEMNGETLCADECQLRAEPEEWREAEKLTPMMVKAKALHRKLSAVQFKREPTYNEGK